jgi:hypothetical protein
MNVLKEVGADFYVYGNDAITYFEMPALETIKGGLDVYDNKLLDSFDFPAITVTGGLQVYTNEALGKFKMPLLEGIKGDLLINENAILTGFDLSTLADVGGNFTITDNVELPTQTAQYLANQTTIGGVTTISGNKL